MITSLKKLLVTLTLYCITSYSIRAQCLPTIKIDGNEIVADENNPAGIKLPSWLAAGQTLAKAQNVYSIAVIEFTVNGTALDYSRNISVSALQTVPVGKVWKLESIHKDAVLVPVVTTYAVPGIYSYTPPCSGNYYVTVWGGGGGGTGGGYGAGAGGGYSEGFYYLLASNTYTVTVGNGGVGAVGSGNTSGGASSLAYIISADGGKLGFVGTSAGGKGTSQNGFDGGSGTSKGGNSGGNVGIGGAAGVNVTPYNGGNGTAPGGGGGSAYPAGSGKGGNGGDGRVVISSSATQTGTKFKVPCATLYMYDDGSITTKLCPTGWIDAGYGYYTATGFYCRTCYRCD